VLKQDHRRGSLRARSLGIRRRVLCSTGTNISQEPVGTLLFKGEECVSCALNIAAAGSREIFQLFTELNDVTR